MRNCIFLLVFCVVLSLPQLIHSQVTQAGGLIGISNFLGDVGGDQYPERPGIKDIQFRKTKPSIGGFIRMPLKGLLTLRVNFMWGYIGGDDALTSYGPRHNRNMSFRSPIIELSLLPEFSIIRKKVIPLEGKKRGLKYDWSFRNASHYFSLRAFAGAGLFYFNPRTKYNGKWYALQPLGTEGQDIPEVVNGRADYKKKYTRIQPCIPLGIEISYPLTYRINIGINIGWRYTFTDYLDDVSNTYADPDIIRKYHGDIAATLSSRTNEITQDPKIIQYYTTGHQRGDSSDKDSYIFTLLNLTYMISVPTRQPQYKPHFQISE